MSGFYSAYSQNTKRVEDGVWVNDFEGGVAVCIRKPSSIQARNARRKLEEKEPYRVALQKAARKKTNLPLELEDQLNREWVARGIVVDWKNVPDEVTGSPLKFTPENAIKVFESAPGFYEEILFAATTDSVFDDDEVKENEGN